MAGAKGKTGRAAALAHIGTDRQCQGENKRGEQCQRHVVSVTYRGTTVYGTLCNVGHNGDKQKSSLLKKAKEKRLVAVVKDFGKPIQVDPADALMQLVWEAHGNVARWRELVQRLRLMEEFPLDPEGEEYKATVKSLVGPDHLGNMQPNVILKLYNEERDREARYVKEAVSLGLAERYQRMNERNQQMMAQILLGVISDPRFGFAQELQLELRRAAATKMREMSGAIEGKVLPSSA